MMDYSLLSKEELVAELESLKAITEKSQSKPHPGLNGYTLLVEDSINEYYLFHPESFKVVYANTAATKNLGYTKDELLGMTAFDIRPDLQKNEILQLERRLPNSKNAGNGLVLESEHTRKDGTKYCCKLHTQIQNIGEQKYIGVTVLDSCVANQLRNSFVASGQLATLLMQQSPSAIGVFDLAGKLLECNKNYTALFDSTKHTGINLSTFLSSEPAIAELIVAANKGKSGILNDYYFRDVFGSDSDECFSITVYPLVNELHFPENIVIKILNETEDRKKKAIQLDQALLHQTILKTSIQGFALVGISGILLEVNEQYCKMTGYSESELLKMSIGDIDVTENAQTTEDHLKSIIKNGSGRFETKHRRKNGDLLDVAISAHYLKSNVECIVVFIEDITERKDKELRLIKSEERLQLVLKVSKSSIFENNFITGAVTTTPDLYLHLGYSEDEIPTDMSQLSAFIHPSDMAKMMKSIDEHVRNNAPLNSDTFRMKAKDGSWHWIEGNAKVAKISPEGNPEIFVGISRDITLQKEAQLQLEESEKRMKLSLQVNNATLFEDNFTTGAMITTPDLFYTFGYSDEEIPQTIEGAVALMHPDDISQVFADLEKHTKGGTKQYYTEYRMKDKAGNWRWIDGKGKITQWSESGEAEVILGISQEITSRKEAETLLHQYEHIVATSTDLLALADTDYNYLAVNQHYANALGFSMDQLRQSSARNVFGSSFFERVIRPRVTECLTGINVNYQEWFRFPDQEPKFMDVHYIPYYNEDSVLKGFVINARDITAKKLVDEAFIQTKKQLEASEERYRLAISATDLGVWGYTVGDENITYSDACLSQIGYTQDEWDSSFSHWLTQIHPDDKDATEQSLHNYIEHPANLLIVKYRLRHKDGTYRWIHSRAEGVLDENGSLARLFGTHRDFTDLKIAQENLAIQHQELIKAKESAEMSDRMKSSFLANMSHEIRTPMNGILGFADLLRKPDISHEELLSFIEIIEQSGKRMLGIINDLIDISKIESGLMEYFMSETNINELFEYICNFFMPEVKAKGMQLHCNATLPPALSLIRTDKEKLYAILTNLVKNAIKYSDEGSIEIGYELKGQTLHFYVEDTGIGIAPEKLSAVFDRFVQADVVDVRATQGAGLGLCITKAYIEMLGGEIWVESTLGKGSIFRFSLPYSACSAPVNDQDPTQVLEESAQSNVLKILIAEDDEISAQLAAIYVEGFGREIVTVNNGLDAVETLRANPDFDLILMDMKMPQMNGLDATREIRKFNSDVFIIAQTAFGFTADEQKALDAGCNAYVSKPINKPYLQELIRRKLLK